ncbi:hypothetical protein RND81_14G168800 [Saponaria officinalis]|uniref:Aspartic peptidase DDI1-type domain-containing protein n=1 Tax=Saponaria officinalis TaxID=3572 RepID=A0AAW1GNB7_SAPOF
MVNASAGGGFDHLGDEEGAELIKKMVDSEAIYRTRGNILRRNSRYPPDNASNSNTETNAKLDLLTKKLELMQRNQVNQESASHGPPMEEVNPQPSYDACGGYGHSSDICVNNYNMGYEENVQDVNSFQAFNNNVRPSRPNYNNPNTYNPNSNFYHPRLKNHPNMSYRRNSFNNNNQDYGNQQQGYQGYGGGQGGQNFYHGNQENQANQGFQGQFSNRNSHGNQNPNFNNQGAKGNQQAGQYKNNQGPNNRYNYGFPLPLDSQPYNEPPNEPSNSDLMKLIRDMEIRHEQSIQNLANAHKKDLRDTEARMASQALANPQRPPGGFLAQWQSSKDAAENHQAHAAVLRSGVELEDPYSNLDVDVDPKRKRAMMNDGWESPPMTPSARMSELKKGKVTNASTSSGVTLDKGEDGLVEDVPYEEEKSKEDDDEDILVQLPKVPSKPTSPKVSSNTQLANIPYPTRALRSRENFKYTKFCEMLEKLEVTLPFTEVILNMPAYTKFLKDILTKKRTLGDQLVMAMEEECSAFLLNKKPNKLGDPGSFSIPCVVGGVKISRALCDLGASVSVLPLNVARKIGMQDLVPTNMTLQLADMSVKSSMGVLEDVPVKVGKYLIPIDFVVLDIPEDRHTPIILGRPFLATGGVLIDVKDGRLTFRIEGDKVEFHLPNLVKGPKQDQACTIEVIEEVVEEVQKEEARIE